MVDAIRKLFVDVICITQHRLNLDKQWLRLVAKYWRFRDLRKYRLPGLGIKIPFVECLASEFDQDGRTLIRRDRERFERGSSAVTVPNNSLMAVLPASPVPV